jgi:hypothetical protein
MRTCSFLGGKVFCGKNIVPENVAGSQFSFNFTKRNIILGGIYETGKPKIHYFICQAQPGGRTGRRIKQHSESKADAGKIRRR